MKKRVVTLLLLTSGLMALASVDSVAQTSASASATTSQAASTVSPGQVVDALEGSFGVHPGLRRNHAKGTCASGEFIANPAAIKLSRSLMFSGRTIPVIARFSVAGGNPNVPDSAKNGRGMALEFRLPDGAIQHITMLNTPVFGAMQPKTFYDLIVASKPDPATGKADPAKLAEFAASHPDSLAQAHFVETNNPPSSYANSAFWGIHTFKFLNKNNVTTLVRWQFVPHDGERHLTDAELKSASANFLEQALLTRLKSGPAQWDMIVSIGESGDNEDNPTVAWPTNRKTINAGTLSIQTAQSQTDSTAKCTAINFDPLRMADGIQPTNDPILLFRSPAYALSFAKRLSRQ